MSSPGIERPLFNFEFIRSLAGKRSASKLMKCMTAEGRFSGVIDGVRDMVLLTLTASPLSSFEKIASAHLVYVENKGQKKDL